MTSQEIVPAGSTALAMADYVPVAGYETLNPDDFTIPTLKIVQPQSTMENADGHEGQYVKTDTEEYMPNPRLMIVGIAKSRIMFPPEYGGAQDDPLCRSDDAIHPRPEYVGEDYDLGPIPALCADCPYARFPDEGGAPPCTLSENWAGILDSADPIVLRLKGSSAKASGTLKNIMRANRVKRQITYVELSTVFKKTEKGKFYVATITPLKDTPPAEVLELARQFAGINLAARAADEVTEQPRQPVPDFDDSPGNDGMRDGMPF